MAVTLAIETPLQDDVRDLVKRLNAHLMRPETARPRKLGGLIR